MSTKETRKELISASAGILDCNIQGVVKVSSNQRVLPSSKRNVGLPGTWYKLVAHDNIITLEYQKGDGFGKKMNPDGSYMRQLIHHGGSNSSVNAISLPREFLKMLLGEDQSCYVTILKTSEKDRAIRRATEDEIEACASAKKIKAVPGVIARSSIDNAGTIYLTKEERKILGVKDGDKIAVKTNLRDNASISFKKYNPKTDTVALASLPHGFKARYTTKIGELTYLYNFGYNSVRVPTFFMQRFQLTPGQTLNTHHTKDTLVYAVSVSCDVCGKEIDTVKELFSTRHVCNGCAEAGMPEFITDNGGTLVSAAAAI